MEPQLAWIGTGNMGRGMCKNVVEKGNLDKPLIIFNRTEHRAIEFSNTLSGRSKVSPSLEAAVLKADIIFTCLGDDLAINETINTALKGDVKRKLFVDCSTVSPETTNALAQKVTSKGAEFVACPVFGAPAMADAGQLICVLAGPKESVEKVKPYCKGVMGRANIDLSDQPCGNASQLKVVGNTFVFGMIEALAEGHVLAEKSGLGTENLHKFVEIMFPGPYTACSTRMISGDYHTRKEPLFAVELARKDIRHANQMAASAGTSLPIVEIADDHLKMVQNHVGSNGDVCGIYGAARQDAGLKYEN